MTGMAIYLGLTMEETMKELSTSGGKTLYNERMKKLLLVEDDEKLGSMLEEYLSGHGFGATRAKTLAEAGRLASKPGWDIVVLDLMLPDGDGTDFLRQLRSSSAVPVIILTARGDEMDKIVGLEIGADDYLAKPFDPRELVARLRAVLRRSSPEERPVKGRVRFGTVEMDMDAMRVFKDGVEAQLTARQFAILRALVARAGKVISREALMEASAGMELEAFDRSVDVHISRIRAAIEEDPKKPALIKTVRGEGYIFTGLGERP